MQGCLSLSWLDLPREVGSVALIGKENRRSASDKKDLCKPAFLDVDKGNRLERLVIGFGAGASKVDAEVHVYYGVTRRKLIDFRTHADSEKISRAAANMGAGAVVARGVTAGTATASAASGVVKEYHSEVERMAEHSADQALAYLSEFFAKQGWIRPDQVKVTIPPKISQLSHLISL